MLRKNCLFMVLLGGLISNAFAGFDGQVPVNSEPQQSAVPEKAAESADDMCVYCKKPIAGQEGQQCPGRKVGYAHSTKVDPLGRNRVVTDGEKGPDMSAAGTDPLLPPSPMTNAPMLEVPSEAPAVGGLSEGQGVVLGEKDLQNSDKVLNASADTRPVQVAENVWVNKDQLVSFVSKDPKLAKEIYKASKKNTKTKSK